LRLESIGEIFDGKKLGGGKRDTKKKLIERQCVEILKFFAFWSPFYLSISQKFYVKKFLTTYSCPENLKF
jgi:hypothetical protein